MDNNAIKMIENNNISIGYYVSNMESIIRLKTIEFGEKKEVNPEVATEYINALGAIKLCIDNINLYADHIDKNLEVLRKVNGKV